jgi:hypothetical protein
LASGRGIGEDGLPASNNRMDFPTVTQQKSMNGTHGKFENRRQIILLYRDMPEREEKEYLWKGT